MLSNPPYGKSWKTDLERMGGKDGIKDPRFIIEHAGDAGYSLLTRSSDGQLLFLANMLSKMKHGPPLGSRIAEVHNGSSLFTGDAGQGESNIRRWIIENDWLEAIVALPLNMFYNTGIATYIWVLTNRKPAHRKGKVQLIDATQWFKPLRKNLGKKNCELSDEDIQTHLRHLPRLQGDRAVEDLPQRRLRLLEGHRRAPVAPCAASTPTGPTRPRRSRRSRPKAASIEAAPPVIKKIHKTGKFDADPLHGLFEATIGGKPCVVEYEPDSDLRDTEQVPLLEEGGIEAFIRREVLPHAPDAWVDESGTKIGYEISFTRYFYKPQPLRTLEEIRADILASRRRPRACSPRSSAEGPMIDGLKPYPAYKDSGVPWLGESARALGRPAAQAGSPAQPEQVRGCIRPDNEHSGYVACRWNVSEPTG